jgi:hypothetical protein
MKLALMASVPPSRKVYRGLGGFALSDDFFKPDKRDTRGGVEYSFLSTTLDRKVAQQYSGRDKLRGIVLEIGVGKIDSGAQMRHLSQYCGEDEVLFPPLSNLEVVDEPWVEAVEQGQILVVPVKINTNLKAQTIQQTIESRKRQAADLARRCIAEVISEFRKQQERAEKTHDNAVERRQQLKLPENIEEQEGMQALIAYQGELEKRSAEWFNYDNNLKDCWNTLLHMKNTSMAAWFGDAWIEDLLEKPKPSDFLARLSNLRERYTLDVIAEVAKKRLNARQVLAEDPPARGGQDWTTVLETVLGRNRPNQHGEANEPGPEVNMPEEEEKENLKLLSQGILHVNMALAGISSIWSHVVNQKRMLCFRSAQ